ncbi:MAG TPA: ABC transporter permease [Candidatus Acidoferrales bacterium]|nr:ABC transporter permease [Candidatus Acidoferrales bacterium]
MNRPFLEHPVTQNFLIPILAVILSFTVGAVFIVIVGQNPFEVYSVLLSQTLGSSYGIGQLLFKSTPLIFAGLSVAICFRTGLFNIGAEGQLQIGAFVTALVGMKTFGVPSYIEIPLLILAGMVGGGIWGFIPGYLKAKVGAHEVINTIMLNFIAAALISYFVTNVYNIPATVHTPSISPAGTLPRFDKFLPGFEGSPVNLSILIALVTAVLVWYYVERTRFGYELRAVGFNPKAAEYGGISVSRNIILSMTLGGAIAGLVGTNFVMGYKYYFEEGFSSGTGFMGIAVALLGLNNPFGVILAALLFGMLDYGGLVINTMVPKELVSILQAIVIIFVISSNRIFRGIVMNYLKKRTLSLSEE